MFLGPATLMFTFATSDGIPPATWGSAVVVIAVFALLAYGLLKGSRIVFGLLACLAIFQLVVWLFWLVTQPELAFPIAPVMYGLILVGLWLSRKRYQVPSR